MVRGKTTLGVIIFSSLFFPATILCTTPSHGANQKARELQAELDCWKKHPSWFTDYFVRSSCLKLQFHEIAELEKLVKKKADAEQRERIARECLAVQIPPLENRIRKVRTALHDRMTLAEARKAVHDAGENPGEFITSQNDLRRKILALKLSTTCDSTFYFLVNLDENDQGILARIAVWAMTPPAGYSLASETGYVANLSTNYVQEKANREQRERDAAAAIAQREREVAAAIAQREREVAAERERQNVLGSGLTT